MSQQFKVVVEKHSDGYVAYPLGLKGVVVSEGDTYEEVLKNVNPLLNSILKHSGIRFLKKMNLYWRLL